jgi:hypothetical protein
VGIYVSPRPGTTRVHFLVVPVSDKLEWLFVRSNLVLCWHQSYLAESYNHTMVGALVRIASVQAEAIYYVSVCFLTGFRTIVIVQRVGHFGRLFNPHRSCHSAFDYVGKKLMIQVKTCGYTCRHRDTSSRGGSLWVALPRAASESGLPYTAESTGSKGTGSSSRSGFFI